MVKEERLIPNRRFKNFLNDSLWKEYKLGEIVGVTMGQSPRSENYTSDSSYPVLVQGNADIKNGQVIPRMFTKEITKLSSSNSLILTVRAPVGDVGRTDNAVVLGRGVAGIEGNEFIYQLLIKLKNDGYWENLSTGSTFESINSKDVKEVSIVSPIKNEQTQIGKFFQTMDTLINLQQQKITKLKDLKSAYLNDMFPKEGESVPKLRFAGFEEPWAVNQLGNYTDIATGKLDANAMVKDGQYDFYTSGIKKYRIDEPAFKGPAITIAGNGATVGYMHLADGEFNAYQRTYVLSNFKSDRQFLYIEIERKLPNKIQQEARMGNIPYIVLDMLTDLEVETPNLKEQVKIGEFFRNLDIQIKLQEDKLEKLKQMKQAYLNEMFV